MHLQQIETLPMQLQVVQQFLELIFLVPVDSLYPPVNHPLTKKYQGWFYLVQSGFRKQKISIVRQIQFA